MAYNQNYPGYYPTVSGAMPVNSYGYANPQYGYNPMSMPMNYGYSNTGMNNGMNNMSMNNMPNQNIQNNQNMSNMQNQQAIPDFSSMGSMNSQKTVNGNNDIVWVQSDEEVFDYPVGQNDNQMFFDLYRMKMFTKEGATGVVRDFDLHESQESIQRYQQYQQTQRMQFPVIDTTADVVDTEKQADALIDAIERKMEQRFNEFENRLSELSDSVSNTTNEVVSTEVPKKTSAKSMTKRGT